MRPACLVLLAIFVTLPVAAQVRVEPHPNQQALLQSDDPQLAANKRLVYDFWRYALIARDMDKAAEYMHEDYIQHNPAIPTGRAPFMAFFGSMPQRPVPDTIDGLVSIVAEGDLVSLAFLRECQDPRNPGQQYTTTWFDMFRVDDGLVVEHWDFGTVRADDNPADCVSS